MMSFCYKVETFYGITVCMPRPDFRLFLLLESLYYLPENIIHSVNKQKTSFFGKNTGQPGLSTFGTNFRKCHIK